MNGGNKKNDIGAEIERVFLAGSRKNDPLAKRSLERFRARIADANPPIEIVRAIIADDARVAAFIEETRQGLDAKKKNRRGKIVGDRVEIDHQAKAAIPLLVANSEKTLADIERMHAQLTSLLGAVQDEQGKMAATAADLKQTSAQIVTHTAEMKAVSDQTKIDVPKILAQATAANGKLELWPTLRTAIITAGVLAPFTIGTSVLGNKLTTWLETGHWSSPPPGASPPPLPPPTVNLDNRQYWIVLPPPEFDRPFVIPHEPSPHRRPHRLVTTHPKVRAHTKAPR